MIEDTELLEGQIITNGIVVGGMIGQRGAKGDTGNGISSTSKTSTSGLVDTYTITYTNGDTDTFTVTNGEKGDPGAVKFLIVAELPTTGIEEDTIYLVPITPDDEHNNYEEYIYVNGEWELLGKIAVHVDLTGYVQFTDYPTTQKAGVIKISNYGTDVLTTGQLIATKYQYSSYSSLDDHCFISKGTLENVLTGKGVIKSTDIADNNKVGVVKGNINGFEVSASGSPSATNMTYSSYVGMGNTIFISKGTLENVLTEKIGAIDDALDAIQGEVI